MNTKNIVSAIAAALICCSSSSANILNVDHITDSLYNRLSQVVSPTDSMAIMGDLFDIQPRVKSTMTGLEILDLAERTGDTSTALEIIRHLANRYVRNDSMLVELYNRTLRYTDGSLDDEEGTIHANKDEIKETRTFVKLTRNMYRANHASEDERNELLHDLIHTHTLNPPTDLYDQIVLQHSICTLLSRSGSDQLVNKYLDKLGTLIQKLPPSAISLINAYYVHAALIYNNTDQFEKSMQADMKTLEGIKRLEEIYQKRGRFYRNYDANRYIIYQRFLANYPKLTSSEIEKYYKLAMKIAATDPTASQTNKIFPGPQISYNMAHKNYAKALELIKSCIDDPYTKDSPIRRLKMLKYEIECAEALGDKETLLAASREYNSRLENYIRDRMEEKYQELQVIYDTYDIRNNYKNLQIEKQQSEAKSMRIVMILTIVATVILLISVVILFRLYRKNRALVKVLDKSNKALRAESGNLEKSKSDLLKARNMAQKANNLKTDFIKNMSYEVKAPLRAINEYCKLIVDCSDATNKKYLERFSSLVELNSELLSTIVNDVLHISEIDSESVPIHNRPVELRSLSTMVLDGVRHRVNPDVALMFDTASPNISLFTDPQRVHQILLNILTNAAKFTSKGSITLAYTVDNENETVTFSVTDTGIGIKPDKKEEIFERFVKLDRETQGAGLGLTISRMLARILGGDVVLDTTYTKGARFLFILPKK